jgi:hypothetical protein
MALSERFYEAVELRIERLTVVAGLIGASISAWKWGWRAGLGFIIGALLSWLNFRWLDQGLGALLRTAANPAAASSTHVSRWIYARFLGRMALLVCALYVILKGAWFPGRAVLTGLFSLIAGVIVEVTYEVATGFREPPAGNS